MNSSNYDFNNIINFLSKIVRKFNKFYNKEIKLTIKGSWSLWQKSLIDRKPNDIDLCFINNENISDKKMFVHFLINEIKAILIREDKNLITVKDTKYGKIEFILFEYINEEFLEEINDVLYAANIEFLAMGKILMLNYVMSNYYLHDDKIEKIKTTIKDLIYINNKNLFVDKFSIKNLERVILNLVSNSVFIYIFYKYHTFLWWNKELENYNFHDEKINSFFKKIRHIFSLINNDEKIIKFIDFNKKIVELFYDGRLNKNEVDIFKEFNYHKLSISLDEFNIMIKNDKESKAILFNLFEEVIKHNKKLINLRLIEYDKWENHNIFINLSDHTNFNDHKPIDKIKNKLIDYNIPYKEILVNGLNDCIKPNTKIPSVTVSIPADSIHSTEYKISLLNIIYMLQIIYILDTELNDEK
ncbi:hypothetical protein [Metamycoplasma gateae]|uniref:Uncharacterized protein n=1 Tax=Metamycoplasma gateae TaxID=35769 RepID=A0ABZ2AK07_9BACT|nr:hypothetical protein V2E26_02880 [Metamycoplasma gateae]